jgi:hypothetical protein
MTEEHYDEGWICKTCGAPGVEDTCPYDEDVFGKETICTCCPNCRRECAQNI